MPSVTGYAVLRKITVEVRRKMRNKNAHRLLPYFRTGIQLSYLMITAYSACHLTRSPELPDRILLVFVILSGMFFCGWLCPFGTVQEQLHRIGERLGWRWRVPPEIDRYLTWLRYIPGLLLPGVVWSVLNAQGSFMRSLLAGITWTASTFFLVFVLLLSFFVERPYCKYLCLYGAFRSLFSFLRIFTIRRSPEKCISCRLCDKRCPMGVTISRAGTVRDIRCIHCMKCIAVCPRENTLRFGFAVPSLRDFKRPAPPGGLNR